MVSLKSCRTLTLFASCHDRRQRNRSVVRVQITKRGRPSFLLLAVVGVPPDLFRRQGGGDRRNKGNNDAFVSTCTDSGISIELAATRIPVIVRCQIGGIVPANFGPIVFRKAT